jgi:competence protein ComEC
MLRNASALIPRQFIAARPLLCVSVIFIAGTAIGATLNFSFLYYLPPLIFASLIILIKNKTARKAFCPFLSLSFVFCFAIALSSMRLTPYADLPSEATYQITAAVSTAASVRQDGAARFEVSDMRLLHGRNWVRISGIGYVKAESSSAFKFLPGDIIEFSARVLLPNAQANPGGFDSVKWAKSNGYAFTLLSSGRVEKTDYRFSLMRVFASVGNTVGDRIDRVFAEGAPIVKALLIGDRSEMDAATNGDFAKTGIIHLLAVSGLHVGFIYLMLNKLLGFLHLPPKARFAALAVLLAAYACLTALTPSVVRASIMLLYTSYATVVRKKPDPFTSLAFTAAVILLFRPGDILSASFLLSFGCMLGIFMLNKPMLKLTKKLKLPRFIGSSVSFSISAQLGALAPCAVTFGYISPIGIIANMFAIPLAACLFYISVPLLILDVFLHDVAVVLAHVPRFIIEILKVIASLGSSAGLIVRIPKALPFIMIAAIYAVICLFSEIIQMKIKWKALLASALLAAGIFFTAYPLYQPRFVQLAVGQALAGVLHNGGGTVVYDTGGDGQELIDYLLYTGNDVDQLIISHGHMDHCGGLANLLDSVVRVKHIYITSGVGRDTEPMYDEALAKARAIGIPVDTLSAGDILRTNCGNLTILSPPPNTMSKNANDTSVVASVTINGHTLLQTGDIAGTVPLEGVDCDILSVAHHGSGSSTSLKFLKAASPEIAVISCGANNASLPHPTTIERLNVSGVPYLRTDETGAVIIQLKKGGYTVTAWKK